MVPLLFSEVRVTSLADTPVLILCESGGTRQVAVWISAAGGNAILSALEDEVPDHPTTHDLMIESLAVLDTVVESVHLTGVVDGVYSAHIVVGAQVVPCRVTDGVALALRSGAPILAAEELMEAVSVEPTVTGEDAPEPEAQVAQFRAFLDTINPEDFDGRSGQP